VTDEELIAFCGFKPTDDQKKVRAFIRDMPQARKDLYDKMHQVEMWDATDGLVPLPEGVIVCGPKQCREGKRR
jgi:hypothetical protein